MQAEVILDARGYEGIAVQIKGGRNPATIVIGFLVPEVTGSDELWRAKDDEQKPMTREPQTWNEAIKTVFEFWAGMAIASKVRTF